MGFPKFPGIWRHAAVGYIESVSRFRVDKHIDLHFTSRVCSTSSTSVSHLTCPLPPHQSVIWLALYHCITALLHRSVIWLALYHCITALLHQSVIWLVPTTTSVSHLTCPLPPHQSVIWHTLYHCIAMSLCYHITMLVSHLTCPMPPHQSVIWLAHCHHTSQSFDLPSTTASLHNHITILVSLLTCPHHHISQSFDLPLPPHQAVIWHALYHCITMSLHYHVTMLISHLTCPLPHQSVIWLAHCHYTSQSFDLPSTTASLHYHITTLVSHLTCPHHHISHGFDLPPAITSVSHLTCPLPPHHYVLTTPSTSSSSSPSASSDFSVSSSSSTSSSTSTSTRELEIKSFYVPTTSMCTKFFFFLPSCSGWVSPPPHMSPPLKLHSFLSKIMICRSLPPPKILGQKAIKQPLRWL